MGDGTPQVDVRAVLAEIGSEEAVARLEARLEGLERELDRRELRDEERTRDRQGEIDLMRARIEEALDLLRSSIDEHRAVRAQVESRMTALLQELDTRSRQHVDELRDDFVPRVEQALLRLDETEASLRGEVRAAVEEAARTVRALSAPTQQAHDELEQSHQELWDWLVREVEQRVETTGRIEQTLQQIEEVVGAARGELHERVDALRRELDSSVGELRASINLRAGAIDDRFEELAEQQSRRLAGELEDLERRWLDGARDLARRFEGGQSELRAVVQSEREARTTLQDRVASSIEDMSRRIEGIREAIASSERQLVDGPLRRELDELAARLDVVQSKVAGAVGEVATKLTNRVASLTEEQRVLRESVVRHGEHLAAMDGIGDRLDAMASRVADLDQRVHRGAEGRGEQQAELAGTVADLRRELSGVAGAVTASRQRMAEMAGLAEQLSQDVHERAALRREVRELTARNAELDRRLADAERLARATGQAVARLLRQEGKPSGDPGAPSPQPQGAEIDRTVTS